MRYSIFILLITLILSCSSAVHPEAPEVETPELPNNQSIVVEGVAGSTLLGDTLWSRILQPTVLEQGNDIHPIEIDDVQGLPVIIVDSVSEAWYSAHSFKVYAVLESRSINENKHYWYLTKVKSWGYRP